MSDRPAISTVNLHGVSRSDVNITVLTASACINLGPVGIFPERDSDDPWMALVIIEAIGSEIAEQARSKRADIDREKQAAIDNL